MSICISASCSFCVCRGTTDAEKVHTAGRIVILEYKGPSRKLEVVYRERRLSNPR